MIAQLRADGGQSEVAGTLQSVARVTCFGRKLMNKFDWSLHSNSNLSAISCTRQCRWSIFTDFIGGRVKNLAARLTWNVLDFLLFRLNYIRHGRFLDLILRTFPTLEFRKEVQPSAARCSREPVCVVWDDFWAFTVTYKQLSAWDANSDQTTFLALPRLASHQSQFSANFLPMRVQQTQWNLEFKLTSWWNSREAIVARRKKRSDTEKETTKATKEMLTLPFLWPTFHRGYVKRANERAKRVIAKLADSIWVLICVVRFGWKISWSVIV